MFHVKPPDQIFVLDLSFKVEVQKRWTFHVKQSAMHCYEVIASVSTRSRV